MMRRLLVIQPSEVELIFDLLPCRFHCLPLVSVEGSLRGHPVPFWMVFLLSRLVSAASQTAVVPGMLLLSH